MVMQTVTLLQQVHLWLKDEVEPPRLENVSLGGSVVVPTTEEEAKTPRCIERNDLLNPIIHVIGDHPEGPMGHVDLNDARIVFGPPDDMLPNPDGDPRADSRGIVIGNHCDHPAPTRDEFLAILDALSALWPDRPIYLWSEKELDVVYAGRTH